MSQNGDGELSFEEKEKAACASYLGLNPARIIGVEHGSDSNGGARLVVSVVVYPGCSLDTFVNRGPNGTPKR